LNSLSDKVALLEAILKGNLLSMAKGIGWTVDKPVEVVIASIERKQTYKYKGIALDGFEIIFQSNIYLPDYIGIGKGASHGFGIIKHFKEKYNCIFSIHTNASKKLEWWESAAKYLDVISISHHEKFSNVSHNRNVADYLYSKNVMVNMQVMMDPTCWDKCIESVNYYKDSKHRWSIRQSEIIHSSINYTTEQKKILQTLRPRSTSPWFHLRNNKVPASKVSVIDSTQKKHKIADHVLVLDRLNNFRGWECDVGVDWLNIKPDGTISGICGNKLYDQTVVYNIFDKDFSVSFQPNITPTVCQSDCWCMFETNMPKRKIIENAN
jgi:hypothetical protein